MKLFYMKVCFGLLLVLAFGCADDGQGTSTKKEAQATIEAPVLDVFKSPTCGCCGKWVSHIEESGLETKTYHPDDLTAVKQRLGITPRLQSCHTAVSKDGYVFEGHIPASVMQRFLAEKPKGALGLAVPGMPVGSPGMEMGSRRDSYDVLLLMKDGTTSVYQHIK